MIGAELTGIGFLYDLQCLRETMTPAVTAFIALFSNVFFYAVFPVVLTALFFWFIDKKSAHLIGLSLAVSMLLSGLVKNCVRRPRPNVLDSRIVPLHPADPGSYSFPSSHVSASASSYFSVILLLLTGRAGLPSSRRSVSILFSGIFASLVFLISFSRMYTGNHTLTDVAGGLFLSLLTVSAADFLIRKCYDRDRSYYMLMAGFAVLTGAVFSATLFIIHSSGSPAGRLPAVFCFSFSFIAGAVLDRRFFRYAVPEMSAARKAALMIFGILIIGAVSAVFLVLLPEGLSYAAVGAFGGLWITVVYPLIITKLSGKRIRFRFHAPFV